MSPQEVRLTDPVEALIVEQALALASISTAPYFPIIGRRFSPGERGVFPPTACVIVATDN
jgi:hypothetical protein